MNERFNQEKQPKAEFRMFSGQELINEGKVGILAQQLEGDTNAMIDIFGKEVTIDEMNQEFRKGLTSDQIIKIGKVLGYRLATGGELEKLIKIQDGE